MEYLTNYWAVSLHFCCNDVIYQKNIIDPKMAQIDAVLSEIWRLGA